MVCASCGRSHLCFRMDDKLLKARKARIRSIIRSAFTFLYPLRYLLLIAATVLLVLLLRHRKQQTLFGHFEENFADVTHKSREFKKIDYHNYEQIQNDLNRVGPGEQGKPASLSPEESTSELRKELYYKNGFNALLSDKISINRSIADLRHPSCKLKSYRSHLPIASVVVPFYEEHWSTLLRTIHSVLNRSPPYLLKEIIIVDDGSTKEFLHNKLEDYIKQNLPKVKLVRQPERTGLIKARLAGAKIASSDVLIFLDSHTEAGYNWLPPLLEPIAENPKTCVCPLIDVIDDQTFDVHPQDEGGRGLFDWTFHYKRIVIKNKDRISPTEPFPSPVMAGGLFAIGADFFWELGGYDEELDIWGAEQYEISFKIWQCGGRMLDAPCSRFGHIYRTYSPFPNSRKYDFITRNHKRVAEIWMDEYKQYIYDRDPERYAKTDAGDMTKMKTIREKLMCKPFKWFLEEVAPEIIELYPPVEPEPYASGSIQSVADSSLCIDTMQRGRGEPIGLYPCSNSLIEPTNHNQYFVHSWHRDIQHKYGEGCFDVPQSKPGSPVTIFTCHRINYSKQLPQTSIIVPFFDEHWSTLQRTVYSVLRQTPPVLLKEIILVDDGSTKPFLKQPLDDYIAKHLHSLVRVIHLPQRNGLITARLSGAKVAKGEVLLFLDSHVEVGINWLPPLLEPITESYRTCVCPFIDVIKDDTFEFVAQDEGARGAFDWNMLYKRLPLRPEDKKDPTQPFPSPVMAGGLFAISARFFWELGGYDDMLEIWGAEQYELSFKIWMCGGRMVDAPCSRVGHIYRSYSPFPSTKTYDFVAKNHKRVAEVWMDEYKQYVYAKNPIRYAIDAGDLSKMKQLRRELHCKPFRWFMKEVVPDLVDHYPPVEPDDFASGAIQNVAFMNLCVEESNSLNSVNLALCVKNKTMPERAEQHFRFTWRRDIKAMRSSNCVDASNHSVGAELQLFQCHNLQGNQLFQYDVDTRQIYVGKDKSFCFDADGMNGKLILNRCNRKQESQRWRMGQMNVERLRNWAKYGAKFQI
ncbi:putative polypeptide N-acetylgalactosaminyltransferase 10 [Anopheles merus]|uniref:putative polypeptide N-acetylgalactosaminyltransferase 10 n=1 Tax=Anopheles merus TaxID=30066 RepID=UPI001BE4629A|nr:putative polypeptide N-acetylgalactosaminyltransferase 10 [Anopheles merus]XP_041787375.1 putative polypeptide N-acetylgalactosaminyltransferase 10 [Anopheles merus]